MIADDFVKSLGVAYIGSRLLRASELCRDGTLGALRSAGYVGPPGAVSTVMLLDKYGPMGVTTIARRLGFSHPLIIKQARDMMAAGMVRDLSDPRDNRRRLIALTKKGKQQARVAAELGTRVAEVYRSIFAESGANLFEALERFEQAVARISIADRLQQELRRAERATEEQASD